MAISGMKMLDNYEVTFRQLYSSLSMEAERDFLLREELWIEVDAVTVGVYDRNNHQATGGTAYPNLYIRSFSIRRISEDQRPFWWYVPL